MKGKILDAICQKAIFKMYSEKELYSACLSYCQVSASHNWHSVFQWKDINEKHSDLEKKIAFSWFCHNEKIVQRIMLKPDGLNVLIGRLQWN